MLDACAKCTTNEYSRGHGPEESEGGGWDKGQRNDKKLETTGREILIGRRYEYIYRRGKREHASLSEIVKNRKIRDTMAAHTGTLGPINEITFA